MKRTAEQALRDDLAKWQKLRTRAIADVTRAEKRVEVAQAVVAEAVRERRRAEETITVTEAALKALGAKVEDDGGET